ncbi:MAG: YcxB family protein [Synergistes sp.]|nr:YcxB family protein [Synergistes sp.]
MRIVYRLSKDDYMDFVKYEASFRDNPEGRKKFFIAAAALCAFVCAAEFAVGSLMKFQNTARVVEISAVMSVACLIGLRGMMSEKNRIKSLWVKYGFHKVEKSNMYPIITMVFNDCDFVISSDKSSEEQTYRYENIEEVVPLTHIIMIKMKDKTWLFVSKKGFEDNDECSDFVSFITEKNKNVLVG